MPQSAAALIYRGIAGPPEHAAQVVIWRDSDGTWIARYDPEKVPAYVHDVIGAAVARLNAR